MHGVDNYAVPKVVARAYHQRHAHDYKDRTLKLLKTYGLKFSGESKPEDADEFLERLDDARQDS